MLHDLNLAARYADRIALVGRGALAAIGAPTQVLAPDVLAPVFAIGFRQLDERGASLIVATEPS